MSKIEDLITQKMNLDYEATRLQKFVDLNTNLKVYKDGLSITSPSTLLHFDDNELMNELTIHIEEFIDEVIKEKRLKIKEIDDLLKKLEDYL